MQAGNWRWLLSWFGILLDPWLHLYCWLFCFTLVFFLFTIFMQLLQNIMPEFYNSLFYIFHRHVLCKQKLFVGRIWFWWSRMVDCSWSTTRLHSIDFFECTWVLFGFSLMSHLGWIKLFDYVQGLKIVMLIDIGTKLLWVQIELFLCCNFSYSNNNAEADCEGGCP